jgi:hypothetical protein
MSFGAKIQLVLSHLNQNKKGEAMAPKYDPKELLKDKRVIEEINRHLWIESEKAGHDIGFDRAAEDWLKRFSAEWVKYNMPEKVFNNRSVKSKARAAKSYLKLL